MRKLRLIRQHDEKDCGAACLSMILNYYGKKVPMASIREAIKVDQYGANIYGLLDGAKKYDLSGKAFTGDAENVWNAIREKEAVMPAIIRIVNDFGYEHYIVIKEIKQEKLQIFDPGEGKREMDYEKFQESFLGQIILFEVTETFKKENLKKGSLSKFTKMIGHQKGLLFNIAVLSMFVTATGLAGTFLFRYLIDGVLGNVTNENIFSQAMDTLAFLIAALAVLYVFKTGVEILRGKLLTRMSKNLDLPLMLGYYDHVTKLPMNFFDTRKTGEIISRFQDASKICEAISGATLTLMIDVVLVGVCGTVLYRESSILFLVAISIFALYVLISIGYIKPLDRCNRSLMEQNAQFSSYLKETIDGMETIKISNGEKTVTDTTHNLFLEFIEKNIKCSLMGITKEALIEFVTSIGTLTLLWIGAVQVSKGNMTVGSLVTFYSMMGYFLSPVQNIVGLQGTIQSALVAADRLNDVMDLQEEKGGMEETGEIHSIEFEDVTFRYGNRKEVLNRLNLKAEKGEQISLVGESGCGKSTATKLLMGLYAPEKGRVLINGKEISEYSLESLKKHMAYVPQTTFLFSDTIRNNLLFGLNENQIPEEEELTRILDLCCCQFILDLPMGIDSMLEENGANLSGGQRQRLAIARALLRNPDLLILDEATSALDTVTEYQIQEGLKEIFPNMIVVMVAHRLSTVKNCSQILVMEHGKVVEEGNHNHLLTQNERYAMLWNKQNQCAA